MKENIHYKLFASCLLSLLILFFCASSTLAAVTLQSQVAADVELKGYDGLTDRRLFEGGLIAGEKQIVDTPYHGLALLVFEKGQHYPVILGESSFILNINNPDTLPSFTGSDENEFFYKLLAGAEPGNTQYDFSFLMSQAKQLLESSYSIHTVNELAAMKEKFHSFAGAHYQQLQHSDMLMRLIGQYFMMHEYVDYHIEGAPASDIQLQYEKALISGVGNWLEILKMYIPEHEVLNYCVSLYYDRSMVTLASLIVDNFKDNAYCPGDETESFNFSEGMIITDGSTEQNMAELNGDKIIAFVSDDCPVSMVETVVKARKHAGQKNAVKLIVAPLQELSDKHLAMRRMLAKENMFFINDEKWRKKNLTKNPRLPLFVNIATPKL